MHVDVGEPESHFHHDFQIRDVTNVVMTAPTDAIASRHARWTDLPDDTLSALARGHAVYGKPSPLRTAPRSTEQRSLGASQTNSFALGDSSSTVLLGSKLVGAKKNITRLATSIEASARGLTGTQSELYA